MVTACLKSDAVISEIGGAAGIHVSQLFRWRKELCQVDGPSAEAASMLVPVIVSETAPAGSPASAPSHPEHLQRERVVIAAPANCTCCGSAKPSKLGEDITETLEVVPRQWKVIQTVQERFAYRECGRIAQLPAPFHVTPRGFAGPTCWR